MKSVVENISSVQRRVKVSLSSDIVASKFDNSYKKLQKKAKVQGFRQGKAPLYIVKKIYNEQVVQEVKISLIEDNIFKALEEHRVSPISKPVLELVQDPKSGDSYEFSAVVDILPLLDLDKGLANLKVSVPSNNFDLEKALVGSLAEMVKRKAVEVPAEKSAVVALGNIVYLSHKATCQGENIDSFNVKNFKVELGLGSLLKELEDSVIGMKKEEEKQIKIVLPSDYPEKDLAGKELLFDLVINDFFHLTLPNIDDEFAKDNDFKNLVDMKEKIKSFLVEENKKSYAQVKDNAVFSRLREQMSFEVPETVLSRIIDNMIEKQYSYVKKSDLQKYIKDEKEREKYIVEGTVVAKNTIVIWEIIKKFKIELSQQELRDYFSSYKPDKEEWTNEKLDSLIAQAGESLRENLLFDKATKTVVEKAEFTVKGSL
jgi:trigger factor